MKNQSVDPIIRMLCDNTAENGVVGVGANRCYYNSICETTVIHNLKNVISAVARIKNVHQISTPNSIILFVEYEFVISYHDCDNHIRRKTICGFTVFLDLPRINTPLTAKTVGPVGIVMCGNNIKVTSKVAVCY